MQILPGSRNRPTMMKPMWIILLASFVIMFITCAYIYRSKNSTACNVFSYRRCKPMANWLPPVSAREYTDDEIASHVVFRDILNSPVVVPKNPKIAFMFLTPGSLPFEKLWDNFFQVRISHLSIWYLFIYLFIYYLIIRCICISLRSLILFLPVLSIVDLR